MGIIQEFQEDLENSAIRILQEYRSRLLSDALKLCGDQTLAEDLVASVFYEVFRGKDLYDEKKGSFYPWLKGILRHLYSRTQRRAVNRGTVAVDPGELSQHESLISNCTVEDLVARSEGDLLRQAVAELPQELKDVVVCDYFMDMPLSDIAAYFKLPVGTVKRRLYLARKRLAKMLGGKLGKKPIVVILALLLAAATLFGAVKYIVQLESETENKEDQTTMNIKSAGKSLALASVLTVGATFGSNAAAAEAPALKVYASARGGAAGTDSDATTAVTLTWVVSDYGTGASSTGPVTLEISETSDFSAKTEVEVAASASGAVPVTGTYKVTGLTAGAMRYARLRATNDQSVEGRCLVFPFSSLTTRTSTDWVSRGTVRYVDNQTGSDETGDGSAEHPYATINRAAYHACKFDEIVIRPGKDYVLSETITFPNIPDSTQYAQLTIRSAVEDEQIVIDGGGTKVGIDAYFGGMYYKDLCVSNCVSSTAKVGAAIRLYPTNGYANEPWRLATRIERCRFVCCRHLTASGGALYCKRLHTYETDFIECEAAHGGGAVYADNAGNSVSLNEFHRCRFLRNKSGMDNVSTDGDGGAVVCASSGRQEFYDCTFDGNRVNRPNGQGGSVYGAITIFSNCTFRCGYAPSAGGAVYQSGSGTQILDCKFFDNVCEGSETGSGGGAYYVWSSQQATFRACVFGGNKSPNQGGGAIGFGENVELQGCTFTNNWTGKSGAAMRIRGLSATVDCCVFLGNQADVSGGAVTCGSGNGDDFMFRNCLFAKNKAGTDGGVINVGNWGSKKSQLKIESCTVADNAAGSQKGPAINLTAAQAYVTNCLFSANTAKGEAGVGTADSTSTIDLDHCFTEGDPKFVNSLEDDYTLRPGSGCRNAGVNHDWMVGATYLNPTNPKRAGRIAEKLSTLAVMNSGRCLGVAS